MFVFHLPIFTICLPIVRKMIVSISQNKSGIIVEVH